jgi:NADPH2:quinone reductase
LQVGVAAGDTAAVLAATDKKGVDVLIDSVGAPAAAHSLDSLAVLGRWVSVGRLGGNTGAIDLDRIAFKRVKLIGVTFRTRSKEERIACVQACARDLLDALADGHLQPVIERSFRLEDVRAAHAAMESDQHIGKLVLEIQ